MNNAQAALVVLCLVAHAGCGSDGLTPTIRFTDVTETAQLDFRHDAPTVAIDLNFGTGAAIADCDGDGWLDLFLTTRIGANALFRNRGDGTFVDVADQAGVADPEGDSAGAVFADYDNDGITDLYVGRTGSNQLLRGLGGCQFEDVTVAAGVGGTGATQSAAWGDYDGDGWLDLFYTNHSQLEFPWPEVEDGRDDRLFHNDRDGTFTDVSALLGDREREAAGFAAVFFDSDDDGDADLYLLNDVIRNMPYANYFWRNDGPDADSGRFVEASSSVGLDWSEDAMGVAVGDFDNDGDMDLTFSNIGQAPFLRNRGDGTYEDVAAAIGLERESVLGDPYVTWGPLLVDFDNDRWLDLFYAAGELDHLSPVGGPPNSLFRNLGDGTFADAEATETELLGLSSRTAAYGDFNRDGFADIVIVNYDANAVLLEAVPNDNEWLIVDLEGTTSNRDGIGAKLTLTLCDGTTLVRAIESGSSVGAGSDVAAYFGLGLDGCIDQLEIRWPPPAVTLDLCVDIPTRERIQVQQGQCP